MNSHTAQRPVRLNNLKRYSSYLLIIKSHFLFYLSHTALTSSKENIDDAYRMMIEFTETCKRESNNDGNSR
jgi:hypothetical protein